MPRMRSTVNHHARAARTKSRTTRPRRARAAANAGTSPAAPTGRSSAEAIMFSGGPGEGRRRERRLPFVLDPEGVDLRAHRLGDRELGADWVEDARDPSGLSRLHAEGHDVLDLEIDRVADPDAVPESLLAHFDRGSLDAQVLSDERTERLHRATELAAEDAQELLGLFIRGFVIDEHAESPVALGHHLRRVGDRRDLEAAYVRALHLAFGDVEDESDTAAVVGGAV